MNIDPVMLNTFSVLDQHGPRRAAATGRHSQDETGPEGSSPQDGTGTAGAVDPNFCRVCTPKGHGCCRCEIACNE